MSTPDDKLVPAVYKDALRPAAREVGHTLAGVVRMALSPAKLVVWSFERACEHAASHVEHILQKRRVPPDRVIQPPPEISGPIVNQLRLQGQSESLRDLYLNLLATAMDRESASHAHPSFVEIIRQLTPDEARVVALFSGVEASGAPTDFPLISVVSHLFEGGFEQILGKFTLIGTQAGCATELPAASIDNLCRVGLTNVRHDVRVADGAAYEFLERHEAVREAVSLAESRPGAHAELQRGLLEVTDFGCQFAVACTGEMSCVGVNPRKKARNSS